MIVVDTNIIAYLFLNGEFSEQAEKLLDRDSNWVAPGLWRSEFRNVLALYIRKKFISYSDALEIMKQAEDLMESNEYSVVSENVLDLVKKSSCSAYDCEFISLAKELSTCLITEDRTLLKEFPKIAISLRKILGEV